ncbi:hypothetical protein [Streptomyces sp. NPDC085540]|uniref:hypothetical protein n=1 Tax=Streptomyces sp. NPDC085540 TaxID=3365730 RepID=UPI0037D57F3A
MTQATGQEGGEGKEHPPSRMVKLGVLVTIIASIVGLVTTGVATLFNALVADDQLDQSRQVAEQKERAQAGRISYWVDLQPDGTNRLHLMNRSPDPISNIHMFFAVEPERPASDTPQGPRLVEFAVVMSSVPPCSDIVLTPEDMRYKTREETTDWSSPYGELPSGSEWRDFERKDLLILPGFLEFVDRDGVRWSRASGLLTRNPPETSPTMERWGVVRAVSPQTLKSCADERA